MKKILCVCLVLIMFFTLICGCNKNNTTSEIELTVDHAAYLLKQSYNDYLTDTEFYCREADVEFVREYTNGKREGYLFYLFDLYEGSDKGLVFMFIDKNSEEIFIAGYTGEDLIPIDQFS